MEENNNGFEVISSKTLNSDFKNKNKFNWGKNVFLPFASGVVGCSVVLGTCFGVPAIREKLVGRTSSIQTFLFLQQVRYFHQLLELKLVIMLLQILFSDLEDLKLHQLQQQVLE